MIYQGGCHCGAIKFKVEAPEEVVCQDCNCSICTMSAYLHLIVPKSKFTLLEGHGLQDNRLQGNGSQSDRLQGENNLTTYTFDSAEAKHLFCKICGIKSFYIPRSNRDGFDINVRCLEPQPTKITIELFDGKNWELNAHTLAHLSDES